LKVSSVWKQHRTKVEKLFSTTLIITLSKSNIFEGFILLFGNFEGLGKLKMKVSVVDETEVFEIKN